MRRSACVSAVVFAALFAFAGEVRAQAPLETLPPSSPPTGTPTSPPPAQQGTPTSPPPAQQGTPTSPPPMGAQLPPGAQPGTPQAAQGEPRPAGGPRGAHGRRHGTNEEGDDEDEEGRLRIGFNINAGVGSGGDLSGPALGGTFRIGWQFSRLVAVYGQISPYAWVAKNSKQTVSLSAIAGYQFTPMASVTPVDLLEIAAGPSLDLLSGGNTSGNVSGNTASASIGAFSGTYFAVHGRVALHLGSRNEETGRRRGFTLGLDIHPTFTPGTAVTFYTLGLGYDWL
jgi:hypothetical protein